MSSLEQGSPQETQEQQQKGIDAFLSQEERASLQRMLSHPEDIPRSFISWMADAVAVNIPQIPISQIVGFSKFAAKTAAIGGSEESTASDSYTDLSTVGPTVSGLSDGNYIILYGATAHNNTVSGGGLISLSVNGAAASDDDLSAHYPSGSNTFPTGSSAIMRAVQKTLSGGGNNSVKIKYRRGNATGTARFSARWLMVLRIGN